MTLHLCESIVLNFLVYQTAVVLLQCELCHIISADIKQSLSVCMATWLKIELQTSLCNTIQSEDTETLVLHSLSKQYMSLCYYV